MNFGCKIVKILISMTYLGGVEMNDLAYIHKEFRAPVDMSGICD